MNLKTQQKYVNLLQQKGYSSWLFFPSLMASASSKDSFMFRNGAILASKLLIHSVTETTCSVNASITLEGNTIDKSLCRYIYN